MNKMKKNVIKIAAVVLVMAIFYVIAFSNLSSYAATGYTKDGVRLRAEPNTESEILDTFRINTQIEYSITDTAWLAVEGGGYVRADLVSDEKIKILNPVPDGPKLTKRLGVFNGPCGKETYYDLNMKGVLRTLREKGFEGDYWIREDGAKMFGDYIMVAADWDIYPYGSIVDTSLGKGIVADTGDFAHNGSGVTFDIATNWTHG